MSSSTPDLSGHPELGHPELGPPEFGHPELGRPAIEPPGKADRSDTRADTAGSARRRRRGRPVATPVTRDTSLPLL